MENNLGKCGKSGIAGPIKFAFGLPVLVSSLSGCSKDLVLPEINGNTFTTGDIDELAKALQTLLLASDQQCQAFELAALDVVSRHSFAEIAKCLREAVAHAKV